MSRNVLDEAARALRETDEATELEARATRARVISGLYQKQVHKRTRLAFVLPIAATFLAASAWGAASGKGRLALQSIQHALGMGHQATAASVTAVRSAQRAQPNPRPSATPSPALAEPAEAALSAEAPPNNAALDNAELSHAEAREPSSLPRTRGAVRVAASASSAGPRPAADPAFSLYRAAHTAHFVDRDPARALAAWDAYLAAAPSGTFAPEAQYNRALSLIRLGRNDEARTALQPFADGAYGSYRQAEANALLGKLAAP